MRAELIGSGTVEDWQLTLPQLRKKLADAEAFLQHYASSVGPAAARVEFAVQMAEEEKLKHTETVQT